MFSSSNENLSFLSWKVLEICGSEIEIKLYVDAMLKLEKLKLDSMKGKTNNVSTAIKELNEEGFNKEEICYAIHVNCYTRGDYNVDNHNLRQFLSLQKRKIIERCSSFLHIEYTQKILNEKYESERMKKNIELQYESEKHKELNLLEIQLQKKMNEMIYDLRLDHEKKLIDKKIDFEIKRMQSEYEIKQKYEEGDFIFIYIYTYFYFFFF